ncbi:VVA0879 family protein [Streptomyces sp. Midd1]|uniref:VVA0879 family protein n=1 Tax=Streptomyces sp. Midd3 TaxID=3161191 RepID=UPI0034DB7BE9
MSPAHRTLTQEEFWAEATARFGEDALQWRFQCPSCADVASGAEFQKALEDAGPAAPKRRGRPVTWVDVLGRDCIGRHLGGLDGGTASRGCNWAAYGLIPGPWFIELPDSSQPAPSFPLAPAPEPDPTPTVPAEAEAAGSGAS